MLPTDLPKATYPEDRKSCGHAVRFTKALFASQAAAKAGSSGLLLVMFIAATEDRLHYFKPPLFWQSEILKQLGFRSPRQLQRARQKAVDCGLLHYQRGNKHGPATYWTLVPDWLEPSYSQKRNSAPLTESQKRNSAPLTGSQKRIGAPLTDSQKRNSAPHSLTPLNTTPLSTHGKEPEGGVEDIELEEESQGPLRYGLSEPDEVFA